MKVVLLNSLDGIRSSIPEDEAPQWDTARTYAQNAPCVYNHYIYTSLEGNNKGAVPALTCTGTGAKWKKGSVTNHWAMFDTIINTRTVTPKGVETLTVSVPFNRASAFAVLRMDCTGLTASVRDVDATSPHWTRTYNLLRDRRSRWVYRYEVASWLRDITETAIGLTPRGVLTLEFTRTGGNCAVGGVVAGRAHHIGDTLFDAEPSIKSYSTVSEDVFGTVSITDRYSVKNLRASVYVHPAQLDQTYEFLKDIINKPALWIGDNDNLMRMECLTTYGYLRAVSAPIKSHSEAILPIEIMGMI